ncbi:MAG: acyl carrier protein [Phycisphaerae bacterium]|nr:acyl carrier protein [Phycisphaerae bacterium]
MTTLSHDEVFGKVREVLVDALGVDDDEVSPDVTLTGDLGAESIDFLDIVFRLEKAFAIKIPQGELFPDNVLQDPEYVQAGKVTEKGISELKARLPHANFAQLDDDPSVEKVGEIFTVEAVVKFIENKLTATAGS